MLRGPKIRNNWEPLFEAYLRACLQGERVTIASGLPSNISSFFFFLRRVNKAARVRRVGGLPYLRVRVTLAGGLTFPL